MTALSMSDGVAVLAPAKINLYLHVLGRRADGYHLLDSLVVFADVGDRIEVRVDDGLSLSIDGPFADAISAGDDNLVMRAARALAEVAARPPAVAIRLDKRLPVAAGIGGGSADAAATLRALVRLWALDIDSDALDRLALSMGADVPMCLHARPVFVGGIGEKIQPAPNIPACGLVLVNPRLALPTPQVFAHRDGPFSLSGRFAEPVPDGRALAEVLRGRRNDLSEAAIAILPTVATVLDALDVAPGVKLARMSGSGATCFGLCDNHAAAADAARCLRERHPGWWVVETATSQADDNDWTALATL
jgi:4-diphosphocytidyl-2-C-methyl-D-erythritol kinase